MAKQRHVRKGDELADDDIVVVRGGTLDPVLVRRDALRYQEAYGEFGISVFAARDVTVDELAQRAPLVRFDVLTLVRVVTLRSLGLRLLPTGRDVRHFTVAFDELEEGVDALANCDQHRWANPYHEP